MEPMRVTLLAAASMARQAVKMHSDMDMTVQGGLRLILASGSELLT